MLGEAPERTCPTCGHVARTSRAYCPRCGKRYDRRAPWLGRRMRLALLGAAALGAILAAAIVLPRVFDARDDTRARAARERAALVRAETARLARQQRPHRGRARALRPERTARPQQVLRARRALVAAVEAAILADARTRVRRGQLDGPVRGVSCGPFERTGAPPDHEDLAKRLGRYDCVATKADIVRDGKVVGLLGHPFVAAVDFRTFTFVWCKDNEAPGESGEALATVPLDPACLAAEGAPRVAGGYASPEE